MKKYLLILLILLAVPGVLAGSLMDKPLMNVEDCYNLTVHYELTSGVATGVAFSGCTFIGNDSWFCNCRSDSGSYNLIMQTDNSIIREARKYKVDVSGYVYSFYKDKVSFRVLDWGDYIDNKNTHLDDFGSDKTSSNSVCSSDVQVVYINNTITKVVNQTVEVPVEVIKEVVVENTSRLDALNTSLINTHNDYVKLSKNRNGWLLAFIITLIILILVGFYLYNVLRGE